MGDLDKRGLEAAQEAVFSEINTQMNKASPGQRTAMIYAEAFACVAIRAYMGAVSSSPPSPTLPSREEIGRGWFFKLGDRVRKTKGSSWQGLVVGFYSTKLTPSGYAVESEREPGSVQIYPESALEPLAKQEKQDVQ